MSVYTTQVRFICETMAGEVESSEYSGIDSIIDRAIPRIFDFNFPIFDETYRNVLCKKILKHYYTREIGLETYGLWKLKLDTKLNEIMPYYNKLYKSELLVFNPLYDIELSRTSTRDGVYDTDTSRNTNHTNTVTLNDARTSNSFADNFVESETTSNKVNASTGKELFSDTPQGKLADVESGEYLTTAQFTNSDSTDDSTSSNSSTNRLSESKEDTITATTVDFGNSGATGSSLTTSLDEYIEHVSGKQGSQSYSSMLQEFRNTFLNIDMQVIQDLAPLFMNLY